ncbi:hypothetical protein [Virgibacillus doumboii]
MLFCSFRKKNVVQYYEAIEEGKSVEYMEEQWEDELNSFKNLREGYLLY